MLNELKLRNFFSTQDLDIVVDGDLQSAEKLQKVLAEKYPSFLGSKGSKWEVRSLRHARRKAGQPGYKEALLADFDFNHQNTDTNSIGMVELSESKEPIVRDLKSWEAKRSRFLIDSYKGEIHFYRSPDHYKTARAQVGENPEILSVIRALTKVFQFELSFSKEDWAEMKAIIEEFDPSTVTEESAAGRRIRDTGMKLIKHAVNIEYAFDVLGRTTLLQKLKKIGNPNNSESLAHWMNKAPLRSKPVGQGSGRTAAELGITIVSHETNTYLAYESMTRAHTGDPNVLISRKGYAGETAAHEDGFYTKKGREGAKNTGLTIRFNVRPEAREKEDFIYIPEADFVIFLNKKAFTVIPESLNLSVLEYFKMLQDGVELDKSNLALLEKFKRQVKLQQADKKENQRLVDYVKSLDNPSDSLIAEWIEMSAASEHVSVIVKYLSQSSNYVTASNILTKTFFNKAWNQSLSKGDRDTLYRAVQKFLSRPDLSPRVFHNFITSELGFMYKQLIELPIRIFWGSG